MGPAEAQWNLLFEIAKEDFHESVGSSLVLVFTAHDQRIQSVYGGFPKPRE